MAPVTTIEGIGPRNAGELQTAGIRTVEKVVQEWVDGAEGPEAVVTH